MATVLKIIQDVCREVSITSIPLSVVNNTEIDVALLYRKLSSLGNLLVKEYEFQELTKEASFTALATTEQGKLTDLAGPDFDHIIPDTLTNGRWAHVSYSSTAEEWADYRRISPSRPVFRVMGGKLLLLPNTYAGETWYFEYISKNWLTNANNVEKSEITADTDTPVLDAELLTLGTIAFYNDHKGYDAGSDFQKFEKRLADLKFYNEPRQGVALGSHKSIKPCIPPSGDAWSITS